ncbi:methyltransferase-like protein 25B [Gasterosteus aculeatus]
MFPAEQQRELAERLTAFLSQYSRLSDSYIIEFFSKDHWHKLPNSWQPALQDLTYHQVADLLLDAAHRDRRYPSAWPLSLLAFRAAAHALAFPRGHRPERGGAARPEEFLENQSQSALLGHIFRKHVKPKKQHEIRRLGSLVKQICDQTDCNSVVDVGSGQGHLTRFLSFGLGLSVTAIEADRTLVATATKFDRELVAALQKDKQKRNCSSLVTGSQPSPRHLAGWVNPKASWEAFIAQLSAAQCVEESGPTPPGSSRKRLRGAEHAGPPSSHAVQTSTDSPDCQPTSQHRLGEDGSGSSSAACCRSRVCGAPQEVTGPKPGHPDFVLTGLHACGDLSATLLRHFIHCPHVRGITSVACCYMKITTEEDPSPPGLVEEAGARPAARDGAPSGFGYPMSSWVGGLPGHRLSYKAREGACHAAEDYARRLRVGGEALRTHCYRAALEAFIADARPDLRRAGIQTIKGAHLLPFDEYARLGLARVGLPPGLPLDPERVEAMLKQQGRVVVYFSLALLLAPVVETLVLLDRMIYLQEQGVDSQLVPLFDPNFSPRNLVLVALKPRSH